MPSIVESALQGAQELFPKLHHRGWTIQSVWLAVSFQGHPAVYVIETANHDDQEKEEKLLKIVAKEAAGAKVVSRNFGDTDFLQAFDDHQEKYLAWKKKEPGTRR